MNFILRRISSQGVEMNFNLGNGYTVVHKDNAPETFKEDFKLFFNSPYVELEKGGDSEFVYAFVGTECGTSVYPLYKDQRAYIMLPDGGTFSNITYKY